MPNARFKRIPLTITSGQSLSGIATTDGRSVVGIVMPAAWTAANLTFSASADAETYNDVYSSNGVELNFAASTSRYITVDPTIFLGFTSVKVRSGTSGSAVTQGADRIVTLVVREFA